MIITFILSHPISVLTPLLFTLIFLLPRFLVFSFNLFNRKYKVKNFQLDLNKDSFIELIKKKFSVKDQIENNVIKFQLKVDENLGSESLMLDAKAFVYEVKISETEQSKILLELSRKKLLFVNDSIQDLYLKGRLIQGLVERNTNVFLLQIYLLIAFFILFFSFKILSLIPLAILVFDLYLISKQHRALLKGRDVLDQKVIALLTYSVL